MAAARSRVADDNYNDVLTAPNRLEPAGKQACIGKTHASTHLVWISQGIGDALTVFRKQVRMSFSDMSLSLIGQFDLSIQVWAIELSGHIIPPTWLL
jgi:hypothetical protein